MPRSNWCGLVLPVRRVRVVLRLAWALAGVSVCAAGALGQDAVPATKTMLTAEQAGWLKEHAVGLKSVEAGQGFEDLMPLKAMVGDARMVGLGEGTHGTREYFQAKHRLLEFLVEEMGFTIFSIEANMPESYALNDYVLGGEGDVEALIGGMYFWTWNTEEVREMVRWMRERNARVRAAGGGADRMVQFTGFDMQTHTVALRIVEEFLRKHDAEYAKANSAMLADVRAFNVHEGTMGTLGIASGTFPVMDAHGKTLRVSGWIRTEGVDNGWAGLWMQVEGPNPWQDNMQNQGPRGTADWKRVSFETKVPDDAMAVHFGVLVSGKGTAWFDGLTIEVDGKLWNSPQFDLGFEGRAVRGFALGDPTGAISSTGYVLEVDDGVAHSGKKSLRMGRGGSKVSAEDVERMTKGVLDHMIEQRGRYVDTVGTKAADWAIQNARVVHQWSGLGTREGSAHRDACMAENALWIAEQNPGAKVVLWAHNWHLMDESPWMGSGLRKNLGTRYVILAFCSSHGTYAAMGSSTRGLGTHRLSTPPADSFEAMLEADGRPILLVDLRSTVPGDPGSGWLAETRPFGGVIGALQMDNHYVPTPMRERFDLLLYVRETTEARQLGGRRGG